MRSTFTPAIAAAAGLAAAMAGIGPATGAPGAATRAGTAPPQTAYRAAPAWTGAGRIVTLPTGDLVGLSEGAKGAPITTVLGTMSGGAATSLRVGGSTYLVPVSVQSVVGGKLDPQLFNATRIAERVGGRTPVTVNYASAGSPTAVPGVEVSERSGLTGHGYITPASSRALGRALASTTADRLFAGVHAVKLADAANPAPRWPMHTVTLKLIGRDGRPAMGMVAYLNVTEPEKGVGFAFANYKGIAKVSMPTGTYQLIGAGFATDGPSGYLVTSPEFTISGPATASIDLRTATQRVSTRVSKPLGEQFVFTGLSREIVGASGGALMSFTLLAPQTIPIHFAPTVGPLHGNQALSQSVLGTAPTSAPTPYVVVTMNTRAGRLPAAPVRFVTSGRSMVTANSVVSGLRDYSGSMFSTSVGDESGGYGLGVPLRGPRLTRYISAGPGLSQSAEVFGLQDYDTMTFAGWQSDRPREGRPGSSYADPWLTAPLHSRFPSPAMGATAVPCPACVGDGEVTVLSLPMSDANPGHFGNPDVVGESVRGTYAVLADGNAIASGDGFLYFAGGEIPSGARVITARQSATRMGSPFRLTTRLTSEMSTRLAATIALPSGMGCPASDTCRALPMLSADYAAAVDLDGRLSAGRQAIGITVHQVGRAAPTGVTSVKAWLSYDGHTWTAAPVDGSGGSYRATVTVPRGTASSPAAGLKVAVTDAAGSTLTETIDGAFLLPR